VQTDSASPPFTVSPWFSVNLSFLLPGVGQYYAGRIIRGAAILFCSLLLVAIGSWTFFSERGDLRVFLACTIALILLWLWNLYDAYMCSSRTYRVSTETQKTRDPWLAVLLSFVVPGLGHAYMRQWIFAIIFVAAFIATLTIPFISPFTSIFVGAAAGFSVYIFSQYRRETGITHIVFVIGFYLAVELFLAYVPPVMIDKIAHAEITPVAGDSMAPTILDESVVLVSTNKDYSPQPGDIVSFQHKNYPEIKIIKRVVALPGQTIEIKNKKIYINGVAQAQPGYSKIAYLSWGRFGVRGRSYTVQSDSYFVLGDNSLESRDSRSIGAIHKKHIVGRAYKTVWPLSRWGFIASSDQNKNK
jgi:signal peptidase I